MIGRLNISQSWTSVAMFGKRMTSAISKMEVATVDATDALDTGDALNASVSDAHQPEDSEQQEDADDELATARSEEELGQDRGEGDGEELMTDRIGTDVLDSLFTDRSDGDDQQCVDEIGDLDLTGSSEVSLDVSADDVAVDRSQQEETTDQVDMEDHREEQYVDDDNRDPSPPPQDCSSTAVLIDSHPAIDSPSTPQTQYSPTRPPLPSRPPRPANLTVPSTPTVQSTTSTAAVPLQLITFDVGGKIFKCKASLIRKFPTKRLCHVISCGCEQIDTDTFFIDRNPANFEIILDWYRTSKRVHPLPLHVNEEVLKEDARYFDLYEELFPAPVKSPPTTVGISGEKRCTDSEIALPRLPERPVRDASRSIPSTPAAVEEKPPTEKPRIASQCRFSKRETRHVGPVNGTAPVWFAIRSHEHLVVESVKGSGRLFVRVTDSTGMAHTFVEQAVLFDSRSWFYLQDDGRAKLQNCVLPGNHVYTFWMEQYRDLSPSPPPAKAKQQQPATTVKTTGTKQQVKPQTAAATVVVAPIQPEMEVDFRIISTFTRNDEMQDDGSLVAVLQTKGGGWGEAPSSTVATGATAGCECLFLPPKEQSPVVHTVDEDHHHRDAIAEQIRAQATKDREQRVAQQQQQQLPATSDASVGRGALKRGGATIVHPPVEPLGSRAKMQPSSTHGGERVTVHQQVNLAVSPRVAASKPRQGGSYAGLQPR